MQMMTWVGRSMAGCLTVALVACSVQQGDESRTEKVVDVKQSLQVLAPEAKATKRLQDIRTVGASIDADKEELARGGYTDQADYEAKVASIAARTKEYSRLNGAEEGDAAPSIQGPTPVARTAAQDAALKKEMARFDMRKPADVAAYGLKKKEILGE